MHVAVDQDRPEVPQRSHHGEPDVGANCVDAAGARGVARCYSERFRHAPGPSTAASRRMPATQVWLR